MDTIAVELALQIGGIIFAAVVLVLGMKYSLNGIRDDIKEIKVSVNSLVSSDASQNERLVKVETEMESRKGWVRRIEESLAELARVVERRLAPRD